MGGANGASAKPLLFPSVLGSGCEGKKVDLGDSFLPKTLEVPLDSSALLAFAGGKKLNLGGSLLSTGC